MPILIYQTKDEDWTLTVDAEEDNIITISVNDNIVPAEGGAIDLTFDEIRQLINALESHLRVMNWWQRGR